MISLIEEGTLETDVPTDHRVKHSAPFRSSIIQEQTQKDFLRADSSNLRKP